MASPAAVLFGFYSSLTMSDSVMYESRLVLARPLYTDFG